MGMKIIGVTGGIGAGKSSVSGLLKEMGAVVLDADRLSHEVVEPGKPAWVRIRDEFGEGILLQNQSIDRKKLAQIVFDSQEKRLRLEAIIHAEVINEMKKGIESLKRSGFDGVIVLDVPIPVKHGFLDTVDKVWVVTCNDEERIRRVKERSGISREEALSRIKSQLSQEDYIKLADSAIPNEGNLEDLRKIVAVKLKQLQSENGQ